MIKVEKINADLFVVITKEYEAPEWLDRLYGGKYTTDEKGNLLIPCRKTSVKITKPVIVKTPMGHMTRNEEYTELWNYFDIPMKSLLVEQGDDITEELGLALKEQPPQVEDKTEEQKEEVKE